MATAAATSQQQLLPHAATLLPTLYHCSDTLPLSSFAHYHGLIVVYKVSSWFLIHTKRLAFLL